MKTTTLIFLITTLSMIVIAPTTGAQVSVPNVFNDGTPAVAQQVNENFQSLAKNINDFVNDGVFVKPTVSLYWDANQTDPNPSKNITYTVPAGKRLFVSALSCSMRTPYTFTFRDKVLRLGFVYGGDTGDHLVAVRDGQTVWDLLLSDVRTVHFYDEGTDMRVWGRLASADSSVGGIDCILHGVLRDM